MEPSALQRVRLNHALEHATMHMLTLASPTHRLAARSDWSGITYYGQVDTQALLQATESAVAALSAGQRHLAVHPRCGSVISVSMLTSMLAAWLVHSGLKKEASPARALLSGVAAICALGSSRPVSRIAQAELLTDARVVTARIQSIAMTRVGPLVVHRLLVSHS